MRKHPILGTMRGHMGVDYAASSGTPIMAAGDARVQFVGWKGGYGRAVILDHGRVYTPRYGHMSAFGTLKPGPRLAHGTTTAPLSACSASPSRYTLGVSEGERRKMRRTLGASCVSTSTRPRPSLRVLR